MWVFMCVRVCAAGVGGCGTTVATTGGVHYDLRVTQNAPNVVKLPQL